jgi:hypothetical protein
MRPKTTPCGHPKQGIQGAQNQSLVSRVEVAFLGNLGPEVVSILCLRNFLERDRFAGLQPGVKRV